MIRELPTPPPAHQHSPTPADVSRAQTSYQQLLYQQFVRQQQHMDMARIYSPAPPPHAAPNPSEAPNLPPHLRALAAGGEHRSTESPLQGSVAVPLAGAGYHRPAASGYQHATPAAPPSPSSHQPRQTHVYAGEEAHAGYRPSPPPAHLSGCRSTSLAQPTPACEAPSSVRPQPVRTPPHASQVPPQADSLVMLLQRYPIMWQGLMALKNDHAVVQMHFISGNPHVARGSLPVSPDGLTLPLRIAQRMRLEQQQLEGVMRKIQIEQEHCILLALPCGRDAMDVLQQSNNLRQGFITYLQLKQAAGIVNIAAPGSHQVSFFHFNPVERVALMIVA